MARNNTVKVSDKELSVLKEVREERFGTTSVPLGEVITELYDEISVDGSNTHKESRFREDFAFIDGKHIIMGGRQIGKTSTLVRESIRNLDNSEDTLFVSPNRRTAGCARDKIDELAVGVLSEVIDNSRKTRDSISFDSNKIVFTSAAELIHRDDESSYDNILVDDASHINNSILKSIDTSGVSSIVYASTPKKPRGFVELWAEYSSEHTTWHVPSDSVNHINDDWLVENYNKFDNPRLEFDAEYWIGGGEPELEPDYSY